MNKNKHDFSPFYIAMASVAFFVVGMPVLDSIGQWVQNVFGLKSVKLNAEAKEYVDEPTDEPEVPVQAVGFQIPDNDMGCCEDE